MAIQICSAAEQNVNTRFQRNAEVIAEIFRAKTKNYFSNQVFTPLLKKQN